MYFEKHEPSKDKRLEMLDENGRLLEGITIPEVSEEELLHLYKLMLKTRVMDTKALQYQRQGRMLTYAPNLGQEASQVGSIAATGEEDWMVSAFRELGAWFYKGVPMEKILLYWYGNEAGMHMPDDVKVLPVSVPIASQLQHAVGVAYASVYRGLDEVTMAYVGDGGTSQGDFHEALNHAAVLKAPVVFIIQNNQYAISMPRKKQTTSPTLAEKAKAYGMPGIQVDGNDLFAVLAASREAVERARAGEGPSLIECETYRLGAHTTSDDPKKYREEEEVEEWKKKDPLLRMKRYLIDQELWSEEQEEEQNEAFAAEVKEVFKRVEDSGLVPLEDVFDYQYHERPPHLEAQYQEKKKALEEVE